MTILGDNAYSIETICENGNKIELLSLMLGVSIGILLSSAQAFIHYATNPEDVVFLGMGVINALIGVAGVIVYKVCLEIILSKHREELIKLPEKK